MIRPNPLRKKPLHILVAQINWFVGDVQGNYKKMESVIAEQGSTHNLIVFSELSLVGYSPEDLLFEDALHGQAERALERLQEMAKACAIIVGHPHRQGTACYNAASFFWKQQCWGRITKRYLVEDNGFRESRYFRPGTGAATIPFQGLQLKLFIGNDLWHDWRSEKEDEAPLDLIVSINAAPYIYTDRLEHVRRVSTKALQLKTPIIYVNQIGGHDEWVFEGGSLVVNAAGTRTHQLHLFQEATFSVPVGDEAAITTPYDPNANLKPEAIYQALCLGLQDFVRKNGFKRVLLGLSGGVDSALALAVDALGPTAVRAVMLPACYTSAMSKGAAMLQSNTLKVECTVIDIMPLVEANLAQLANCFGLTALKSVTAENVQARSRALLLMAIANQEDCLLLTTGNKSELAMGYATMYGDMAGGFNPLKDSLKTLVYELAYWRNTRSQVIPDRTLSRPPSAEVRYDQTDQEVLPPYPLLDKVLELYLEQGYSVAQIVAQGLNELTVSDMVKTVLRTEYKRRQGAPGTKITPSHLRLDRYYPMTFKAPE